MLSGLFRYFLFSSHRNIFPAQIPDHTSLTQIPSCRSGANVTFFFSPLQQVYLNLRVSNSKSETWFVSTSNDNCFQRRKMACGEGSAGRILFFTRVHAIVRGRCMRCEKYSPKRGIARRYLKRGIFQISSRTCPPRNDLMHVSGSSPGVTRIESHSLRRYIFHSMGFSFV